jgi:hypothetical protein
MTRPRLILTVAVITGFMAAGAAAHDSYRIVGVITQRQDTTISVKSRDEKTTSIGINQQTEITRNMKRVDLSELKAGASVVVDALGDSEADLTAIEVQLVPRVDKAKK